MNERAVTADKVDADLFGYFVHRPADLFVTAARRADQADGRDGYALVDDGYAVLGGDVVARFHEIARKPFDLAVNLLRRAFFAVRDAVEQRDRHRDGADVEVLTVYHFNRFVYFAGIDHLCRSD